MRNPSGNGRTTKVCTSKPPRWITADDAGSGAALVDVEVLGALPLVGELGGVKNEGVVDVELPACAVAIDRELGVVLPAAVKKILKLLLLLLTTKLKNEIINDETISLVELNENILSLRTKITK